MAPEVKLNRIQTVLADLTYPIRRDDAIEACADVTLVLAEGTERLGDVIGASSEDVFVSADDLPNEVMNLLPRHAVGEPYQSEGDA